MKTQWTVTTHLTTYTVTPLSPTSAQVDALELFKVNRNDVIVRGYTGTYTTETTYDDHVSGPWFTDRSGYRTIYTPEPNNINWGEVPTPGALTKVRADIQAAILPLFQDAEFIEAGMVAAYRRGIAELKRQADRKRADAAELIAKAEKMDNLAAVIMVANDALTEAGLDGRTPDRIVADYASARLDYQRTKTFEEIAWRSGVTLRDSPAVHDALALRDSVQ